MLVKRTKTTEVYILPKEFDTYSKKGFVIFVSKPTVFGTYKAIKIELVKSPVQKQLQHFVISADGKKSLNPVYELWNMLVPKANKFNFLTKKVVH